VVGCGYRQFGIFVENVLLAGGVTPAMIAPIDLPLTVRRSAI
jgi:hypothetical protein